MAHAYALILLRRSNAYPCVFYGDLYGILGSHARPPACGGKLPKMIMARKLWAYGDMDEYWDSKECVGQFIPFLCRKAYHQIDPLSHHYSLFVISLC